MAYSAPELLLVGAAQNLVLGGSFVADKENNGICEDREQEDEVDIEYDNQGLW